VVGAHAEILKVSKVLHVSDTLLVSAAQLETVLPVRGVVKFGLNLTTKVVVLSESSTEVAQLTKLIYSVPFAADFSAAPSPVHERGEPVAAPNAGNTDFVDHPIYPLLMAVFAGLARSRFIRAYCEAMSDPPLVSTALTVIVYRLVPSGLTGLGLIVALVTSGGAFVELHVG
jgi:hypothetical protein